DYHCLIWHDNSGLF
nr:immunoglobulin light chain junction region [Macaca mulatta]MOX69274.1 immunoglobulin light chain junction region [Macaca mulatta]MOX69759.1 immunoglobulin light chain junction region [Macaca mulatta]MOX69978.1 immunoglobulin light chain junction region [Macaca mulatta]MOX76106.1 immunoglobulin light chain junction region [Macaca mulatta]